MMMPLKDYSDEDDYYTQGSIADESILGIKDKKMLTILKIWMFYNFVLVVLGPF